MKTYPLTQTQLGIFLADSAATGNAYYNIDMLYHLDAGVDVERFKTAVEAVIDSHPYVKSRLVQVDGGEVRLEDHSSEPACVEVREIDSLDAVKGEMSRKYDLLNDRLYRLVIYKVGNEAHFLMSFHHIIFDGMSGVVFNEDLNRAYAGEVLTPQGKDGFTIALEEEAARKTDALQAAKQWHEQEFGAMAELDSFPLPDVYGKEDGKWVITDIGIDVTEAQVKAFSEKHGVKASIPFTAAFGYTLANYTASDEVLYTTAYHGRSDKATRHALTMMVKTFPVSHDYRKTPTVSALIEQTATQIAGTRSNTLFSLADCSNEMGFAPRTSFVYQGTLHDVSLYIEGRRQASDDLMPHAPGLDFIIQLIQVGSSYKCKVEYHDGMFSAQFVEQFVKSYGKVLSEMMVKENLADIEFVDEEQIAQLDGFNRPMPGELASNTDTVVSCFKETAAQYPDNIAVVFKDKKITYKELDEKTDTIAAHVSKTLADRTSNGVGLPVVSILIDRSELMPMLPIAVQKANAAYQPLDPSYPQDRLNFMIKDADAQMLIADRHLRPVLHEYDGDVLYTDEIDSLPAAAAPQCTLTPQSAMNILYTSGSTGVPKGVVLEQGNIVTFSNFYRRYNNLTASDKVSAYASFGFDANMMDTYPALTTGAAMVIIPEEIRLDLEAINDYLAEKEVTISFFTTQVGQQFVTAYPSHKTLKHVSMGGEKMASIEPPVNYTMHNLYGPTECTVYVTITAIKEKEPNIPLGPSNDTAPCTIVNKHGKRLPVGAAGELIIHGPQVSRGYLNRLEKTAEVFGVYGEKSYRTGDIVRYRENGMIEFVGRKDGQVKIRGFRVELKEVETVIREFDGIKDATVQAFDLEGGGKYIAAYVVSDEKVDIHALNEFIQAQKPPYMVPAVTMQIDAIPLNVNQKVDKKKLPVAEYKVEAEGEYHAPVTEVQKQLAQIVSQILSADNVSIDMPLSHLGLSSLLAMKLSFQIQKELGVKVSTRKLVSGATIQDIEKIVAPEQDETPVVEASAASEYYPLTGNQRGVYIDWEMNRDTTQYNMPSAQCMPGVTVEQLREALVKIAEAHEYMFTRLAMVDGEVMQHPVVHEPQITVTALDSKPDAQFFQQQVKPFNLFDEPLFRFSIYTCQDEVYLFVDTHHIIMDGVSWSIMQQELKRALAGESLKKEEYTAFDRAVEEEKLAHSSEWTEAEAHFDRLLSGIDALTYPHTVGTITPGENETVRVPVERKPIDEFCRQHNVTPSNYFLTMLMQVLHRVSREENVMITTINNGRADYRMQDIFGMFVKTLPIVTTVNPKTPDTKLTVVDAVREMQEQFFDAQERDFYPFTRMVERHGVEALICYAYQAGLFEDGSTGPSLGDSFDLKLDTVKFPIDLNINDAPGGEYEITIDYDDTKYSHEDIVMLAHMLRALAMNALTVQCVAEAGMLEADAAKAIIASSQGKKMDVDLSQTFVDVFIEQATQHPDSVCVVSPEATYTYDQVNRRSNAVARYLMSQGVSKGEFVCISMLGCSDFIVAAIGIEKAGAAYVPVDPEYPEDRKQYMQEDSEAKVVVTEEELLKVDWSDDAPVNLATPDGIAYMIYTSGSTGKPKGVMIPHSAKRNFVQFIAQEWHHTAESRICCHSSVSFDASIEDLYPVLTVGGSLYIVPQDARKDMEQLHQFILNNGITGGCYTTQLGTMLLQQYPDLPVHYLVVGGEKMSANPMCNCRLINTYGPTEFTVDATWFETEPGKEYKNIPIGRPLHNLAAYVVDQYGHLVPNGISGELCMAGPQMARGYWKREDLTAEKFSPARFVDGKIYHTGDLVKYNANGDIEYTGRIDSQVKLRGFRIELGEIETLIAGYEGVQMVSVQVKTIGGVQHLCAYYSADREIDADALKEYLASQLTEYMVPTAYMQLDAMPLTPNGKVNTKALPEPQVAAREYVEPVGEIETFFCNTFAEILGIERVGATDSFFEIGGTSIVAMRVIVAAVKAGYEIVYKNIFDNPSAREMQAYLTGKDVSESTEAEAAVDHEVVDYDYTAINKLLAGNTMDAMRGGKRNPIGVALVTGATGYLGIHLVSELLKRDDVTTVYCLVRGNKHLTAESRLRTQMFYYFGDAHDELFGTKLVVVDGDVTRPETFDCLLDKGIDTVFNCAANVKHFSAGTDIEDINIGGCNTCIEFCLKTGARLVHTSTTSVAGSLVSDRPVDGHLITETQLYWGQTLDNQYIHAKFIAERNVLDAIVNRGLRAKIMRMGNLSSRSSDGEFQINFHSNSFMGQLKCFQTLGCISYDSLTDDMEFSPIDEVAKAITLLSETPDECCVYQVVNSHRQIFGNVIECMRNIGIPVEMVEGDVFNARLQEAIQDPVKAGILQSMLAYNSDSDKYVAFNGENDVYTTQTLFRLGFRWSFTTWDYMEQFLAAIQSLGFFDDDYQR